MNTTTWNISSEALILFRTTCPGSVGQVAAVSIVLLLGVLANIPLLKFAVGELTKGNKKPDNVLIANLGFADIFGLISCLSLELYRLIQLDFVGQDVYVAFCMARQCNLFLFTYVKMMTMAVTAFERYEAVKKVLLQRKLQYKNTLKVVAGIWVFSVIALLTVIMSPNHSQPWRSCRLNVLITNVSNGKRRRVRSILTGIVIGAACGTVIWKLTAAALFIKKHRQQMNTMFGHHGATKEIRFTKVCAVITATYVVPWLFFGIASFCYGYHRSQVAHCAIDWSRIVVYSNFAVTPLVYMAMDKRVLTAAKRIFRRPTQVMAVPRNNAANASQGNQDLNTPRVHQRHKDRRGALRTDTPFPPVQNKEAVHCFSYKNTFPEREEELMSTTMATASERKAKTLRQINLSENADPQSSYDITVGLHGSDLKRSTSYSHQERQDTYTKGKMRRHLAGY